jgi:8-oxo-dGTP pyrophosphatase MutT (NUDIX family)
MRKRVGGVFLLRRPDGAALLQHRDDKPGLPHANLWVPPGGACDDGESFPACAAREFLEETAYRCANLRFLAEVDVDNVPFSPPLRLSMYWDVYDGTQTVICQEGQALAFVERGRAVELDVPGYLLPLWDSAIELSERSERAER